MLPDPTDGTILIRCGEHGGVEPLRLWRYGTAPKLRVDILCARHMLEFSFVCLARPRRGPFPRPLNKVPSHALPLGKDGVEVRNSLGFSEVPCHGKDRAFDNKVATLVCTTDAKGGPLRVAVGHA